MGRPLQTLAVAVAVAAAVAGCGGGHRGAAPVGTPVSSPFVRSDATVATGTSPVAVAVADDAVWVANNVSGTVTRVDPATHRVAGPAIRVGAAPVALAADAGGVWVALASGSVVHVDAERDRVTGPRVAVADPGGIAVADGRVWVTSRVRNQLLTLDAATGRPIGAPVRVGEAPTDVAVGEGGVWVANSADGTVTRVDPRTRKADAPIRVAKRQTLNSGSRAGAVPQIAGSEVLALTVGEGAVWVAKTDSPQAATIQIRRLDPSSRALTGAPIPVTGGIPMRLAAGGGGVWVTDVGDTRPGSPARAPGLQRIDPGTWRVAGAPIRLGPDPSGVAVGATGVWVSGAGDNTLRRIGTAR